MDYKEEIEKVNAILNSVGIPAKIDENNLLDVLGCAVKLEVIEGKIYYDVGKFIPAKQYVFYVEDGEGFTRKEVGYSLPFFSIAAAVYEIIPIDYKKLFQNEIKAQAQKAAAKAA